MNLGQAIIEALESLNSNRLRSGLTILGIVIGVGAVIAMLAVGAGAQTTITGSISGIGSNLLFIYKGNSISNVHNPKPCLQILDKASQEFDKMFRASNVARDRFL